MQDGIFPGWGGTGCRGCACIRRSNLLLLLLLPIHWSGDTCRLALMGHRPFRVNFGRRREFLLMCTQ
eukprot:7304831-Prymnesium_polylepis.1